LINLAFINNDRPPRDPHPALVFVLTFAALLALHAPLLRLPYFWDEAGYYVPAARDLLLTGSLIPQSTVSNAHPPLVMAYLALWWKLVGFAPIVTRTAMLLAASFALLGLFRLAKTVANIEVAVATTILTAIYPPRDLPSGACAPLSNAGDGSRRSGFHLPA
jgi:hypothetical protein